MVRNYYLTLYVLVFFMSLVLSQFVATELASGYRTLASSETQTQIQHPWAPHAKFAD